MVITPERKSGIAFDFKNGDLKLYFKGIVIGEARIYIGVPSYQAYVSDIGITEKFRDKGYGRSLMRALNGILDQREVDGILEVNPLNEYAIKIYKWAGWVITNEKKINELRISDPGGNHNYRMVRKFKVDRGEK